MTLRLLGLVYDESMMFFYQVFMYTPFFEIQNVILIRNVVFCVLKAEKSMLKALKKVLGVGLVLFGVTSPRQLWI